MSRLALRTVLIAAIALAIIAGTYMSVQALSAASAQDSKGMYMLSGSLSNPFKNQAVEESKPKLDTYRDPSGGGRDCESEADSSDL
jgi:ABC-type sugar transport system substrate-binding protein